MKCIHICKGRHIKKVHIIVAKENKKESVHNAVLLYPIRTTRHRKSRKCIYAIDYRSII